MILLKQLDWIAVLIILFNKSGKLVPLSARQEDTSLSILIRLNQLWTIRSHWPHVYIIPTSFVINSLKTSYMVVNFRDFLEKMDSKCIKYYAKILPNFNHVFKSPYTHNKQY